MRRIGTISSAIGFIFLGVWMIINRSNPELGDAIFKWWPVIIIILGIEVLVSFTREKVDTKKVGFNGLIIFVIIVFICVNAFNGAFHLFTRNWSGFSFDKIIRYGVNMDATDYREISATKSIENFGKSFRLNANNAVIKIHKASDQKIKLDAKVYVKKDSSINKYDIQAIKNSDGCIVDLEDGIVKSLKVDLFIPDGCKMILNTDSSSITGEDKFKSSSYEIDTGSSNIELNGGESLDLNIGSGTMKMKDIKNVKIQGGSGLINISGDTEAVAVNLDSGTFNLNNDICKNVVVEMGSGMATIKTKDKNMNIRAELDSGMCSVNSDRRVNSGINKIIGSGKNNIKVKVDSGTIKISSQE